MKQSHYLFISFFTFLVGGFLYCYKNEMIIFRFSSIKSQPTADKQIRSCILFFWSNNRWNKEHQELIWSADDASNTQGLIKAWLSLMINEQLITPHCHLQSAAFTANRTSLFLSFAHSFFKKELSTWQKVCIIESLLRTLRENNISADYVHFLINHDVFLDAHLDFSFGWPISGFISSQLQY